MLYREGAGEEFPQDPRVQLERSVRAVFDSWETPRAQVYRHAHGIPDDLGTAVNIVQMVFGNRGESSGTGVCFTRNPSTGEPGVWGEFLSNAQGEDVVAGIRTPEPITGMATVLPDAYTELVAMLRRLEEHYREMQDIEFTVEEGRLYILQTRGGKRTAGAALRIATDMVDEGLIGRDDAIARIEASQLDQLLHPMIDPKATYDVAAKGLNASPGAAKGKIALDADTAEAWGKAGEDVILVRRETTPGRHPRADPGERRPHRARRHDLARGGGGARDGQAVRRGLRGAQGRPRRRGRSRSARHKLAEGDRLTIDGGTGEVILADVELVPPQINEHFETILGWADEVRRLRVRANADTPEDAAKAREFGARGHRPVPHRAHVHGRGPPAARARDDPGLERRRARARRSRSCSRSSRPTSRGSSRRWPGSR